VKPLFPGESLLLRSPRDRRVDHVGAIGGHFVVQAVECMRRKVPVLVDRASLDWHTVPHGGNRLVESGRPVYDGKPGELNGAVLDNVCDGLGPYLTM
jgi:hypothetical protein